MKGRMLLIATAMTIAGAAAIGQAADETSRYPYDPACPWGRISNGRGMIVRCLLRSESELVLARAAPSAATSARAAASAAEATSAVPSVSSEAKTEAVTVELVPVVVDDGKLPLADRKLSAAKAKFSECVAKFGGMTSAKGEVTLRFLVRAQRGRAEGISVSKRTGVSEPAARCMAEVLDRRAVGEPETSMTGATLVIKLLAPSR